MPSYTAPSLVLPIRKAGLTPILAEMQVTLNADALSLLDRVTDRTLAVLPVHMYGLATDTDTLAGELRDTRVYTIEDACSSLGTLVSGRQSGTWADTGFYSFNRGKNMATLAGGAFSTEDDDLARDIGLRIGRYPALSLAKRLQNTAYSWALAAAVRPLGYTALHPLVSKFKYTDLHTDFVVEQYSDFQSRIGRRILATFDRISDRRRKNAAFVREALEDLEFVGLPEELAGSIPVYNQCPVLVPDSLVRERIYHEILETGLEVTLLYPDPVHRIYSDIWDGTGPDPYPGATDISERILLIPVHSLVPREALSSAVDIIRTCLENFTPATVKEAKP
jgi:dTDP-4-amino-4,6-dideoxygalactose transaminase